MSLPGFCMLQTGAEGVGLKLSSRKVTAMVGSHSVVFSPDVCNSTNLPEVEIISLLEEQLPHYKLRADTIYGYDHDDWLHTPLISPDANIDLTTEQIEETLKYFRK